ncbi:MAG TPA: hypothetical protein VIY27_10320, partial [Myxococcota bacterium]
WAAATLGRPDVTLEALLFYERGEAGTAPSLAGASRRLLLPAGRTYFVPARGLPGLDLPQRRRAAAASPDHPEYDFVPLRATAPGSVALNARESAPGTRTYLYLWVGESGTLTPLR